MKPITIIAAFLFFIQFSVSAGTAKDPQVNVSKVTTADFSFIRGHKQGKNHTVTWGMTNNTGISHFIIERTYEDPNDPFSVWQTTGLLPCTHMPIFKFTDTPFLPGMLTYRITAVKMDNTTIVSPLYTIYLQ